MPLSAFALVALVTQTELAGEISAEEAFRRSLERKQSANVEAVVDQISPWPSQPGYVKLRMWRDTSGRRRTEIISPVSMAGQVSVDDGTLWTTYFPDSKAIKVHPSPMTERDDLPLRMKLVRRNYALSYDPKVMIAGRSVLVVVAKPKNATELDTRRFYLDAANYTALKSESVSELGNVSVQFSVRRVEYPAKLDKSLFAAPSSTGLRQEKWKPPQPLKSVDDAEAKVGFRPAYVRRGLPMGFVSQGLDLLDWDDVTPVAIRLTDGLVRLNVYQFRLPAQARPQAQVQAQAQGRDTRKAFRDIGTIRVEVRGPAPYAVKERIVAEYAKILERRRQAQDLRESPEPARPPGAL